MSIKGRNSVANLLKFELIQAFMHVLDSCKNEEDPIKKKALECSQDFSHYKSMGIFPDAQGQLTRSPWSDLAEFRTRPRCYGCPRLPASMKTIRLKMKALEWT